MTTTVVLAMVSFEDDTANPLFIYNQIQSVMVNASVARIGEAGERTSYVTVGTENADGTITPTNRLHVDIFGIVREGDPDPTDPPNWIQPLGAQDAYPLTDVRGDPARVTHNGSTWVNTSDVNTQAPSVFGWTEEVEPGEPTGAPAWAAWTSGLNEDLYKVGDVVSHNGSEWTATTGNNYWEPGVFGWSQNA